MEEEVGCSVGQEHMTASVLPTRKIRYAGRHEEDGVVAPDIYQHRSGQCFTGTVPAPRAQIVIGRVNGHIRGDEYLERLGHDLGADAVPADHGEPYRGRCHGRTLLVGRDSGISAVVPPV